ncbi:MAG: tRNA (N(6)-L-threonylcarbamoyladenosine(37)-C(2))-methylthiotransferase MtaB [Acidobacteria bacterium]|nr:tRNA (N(6)-L-threonylcarbamoyladenosine(37)-C(2))-methylthiotransferase MtaB [Acidobacteriota bacterium]
MRIRVDSIGCRLNIGEMDALARRFAGSGHRMVGPGELADLVVFNTCAVTHVASRKSRKVTRQIRRALPDVKLVVTGCYADLSPAETSSLGVDLVVSNLDKDRLHEILEEKGLITPADPIPASDVDHLGAVAGTRTRAFLKVQDGCDNRCTFCIVTVARGDSRSRPIEDLVREVRTLVDSGTREVVLTGVHLGSFGHDKGRPYGLEELVEGLLKKTSLSRLRLSSLEPWDLRPELFDLWSDSRLQPHLHLPLQSGCDATLARMARHTSQKDFSALLDAARARIPDLAISTDLIVGFPNECDAEFEESIGFVREMSFSRLHVFRYSRREGTAAASMDGQVSEQAIADRSARMHELGADLEERYRHDFIGRRMDVLWETEEQFGDDLRWSGLTGNYLRVLTETAPEVDLSNQVTPTKLRGRLPGALYGHTDHSRPPSFEHGDLTMEGNYRS